MADSKLGLLPIVERVLHSKVAVPIKELFDFLVKLPSTFNNVEVPDWMLRAILNGRLRVSSVDAANPHLLLAINTLVSISEDHPLMTGYLVITMPEETFELVAEETFHEKFLILPEFPSAETPKAV